MFAGTDVRYSFPRGLTLLTPTCLRDKHVRGCKLKILKNLIFKLGAPQWV